MTRAFYKLFAASGADRLFWAAPAPRLRILSYHGVCDDALAGEPWMPSYFVSASAFESQLRFLRETAHVLRLSEAVRLLESGKLPPRAVALTFDDGYANNLFAALPLLEKYNTPATVFLSSHYIESGDMYPFLKLRLVRPNDAAAGNASTYKSQPLDAVVKQVSGVWEEARRRLTADQLRTLRPMSIVELRTASSDLIEFGAHTHTHCILGNETPERRQSEIRVSIAKVAQWSGRPVTLFSYPNGEPGDFGEQDQAVLRECGIGAAVTGMGGVNRPGSDLLALRRLPVGLFHDQAGFRAEVCGLRASMQLSGWRASR